MTALHRTSVCTAGSRIRAPLVVFLVWSALTALTYPYSCTCAIGILYASAHQAGAEEHSSGGDGAEENTSTDLTDKKKHLQNIIGQLQEKIGVLSKRLQQQQQQQPSELSTEGQQQQGQQQQQQSQQQQQKEESHHYIGWTNPDISVPVGSGLLRKSRRRVLYEMSIRSHYSGGDRGLSEENRAPLKRQRHQPQNEAEDQKQQQQGLKIDARGTVAKFIGGAKEGGFVWKSDGGGATNAAVAATAPENEHTSGGVGRDSDMENVGCAYYSPPLTDDDISAGRKLPYWNYRLCPGGSLVQFHLEELGQGTVEDIDGADRYEERTGKKLGSRTDGKTVRKEGQQDNVIYEASLDDEEVVRFVASPSLNSLGHYIQPTLTPNTSVLTDEYRSYAKLWSEPNVASMREGFSSGVGIVVPLGNDVTGEVSYFGSGDKCGNNKYRMSRVLTVRGCCPAKKPDLVRKTPRLRLAEDDEASLRILAVEEPRSCRYIVLACQECHVPVEDSIADKGEEEADIVSKAESTVKPHSSNGAEPPFDTPHSSVCQENSDIHLRRLPAESSQHRSSHSIAAASFPPFPASKASENRDVLRAMFQLSYDSYMYNAYPAGELRPVSCGPGTFSLIRLPALTLIDSLDTLVIMGNFTEFARSVERLRELDVMAQEEFSVVYPGFVEPLGLPERNGGIFSVNQNVSLFETNIRVLGGLLSAHQLAEAFIPVGSVAQSDVWDEEGSIRIGEPESAFKKKPSVDFIPMNTKQWGRDEKMSATCPLDDPTGSPPPCTSFDFVEDIARCTKIEGGLNTTPGAKKKTKVNDRSDNRTSHSKPWKYDGLFLTLAHDLGTRLLPAFSTDTGIPYGTVNLLYGVPPGETSIASLAGGGTLSIEMELLSRLTGDVRFGRAGRLATRALWARRSSDFDLLGKHVDVQHGKWVESLSGIGSNSDSFYEYLIKHHVLFPDDSDHFDSWTMLLSSYNGVFHENRLGDWYGDVEMFGGRHRGIRQVFESLMAFWPGMQVLLGELTPAARSTNAFSLVRELLGLLPERFDFSHWRVDGGGGVSPLRPELLESIYFLHMASSGINVGSTVTTLDSNASRSTGWLWASDFALHTLRRLSETKCGHASVKSVHRSTTGSVIPSFLHSPNDHGASPFGDSSENLLDEMPSYFLSETVKYLFLTFDADNNILHQDKDRDWVFTTEAHPLHHVPSTPSETPDQRYNTDDDDNEHRLSDAKERVLSILADEIAARNINSHSGGDSERESHAEAPRMCSVVERSVDLQLEQPRKLSGSSSIWAARTPRSQFEQQIANVEKTIHFHKSALRDNTTSRRTQDSWVDVRLAPRCLLHSPPQIDVAYVDDRIDDDELMVENLSALSFHRLGRGDGSNLAQSCPNYHHSDLRWVYALNGESLDYGATFVTYMSDDMAGNEEFDSLRHAWALSSAASFGVTIMSNANAFSQDSIVPLCPIVKAEGDQHKSKESQETTTPNEQESSQQGQGRELERTRFDMGVPLGQFDVSVLTEEVGFFVEHINSGISVEATILEDEEGGAESVMVVTEFPPPNRIAPEIDNYPAIRSGPVWHWNKFISRRRRNTFTGSAEGNKDGTEKVPYQQRKTMLADSKGSAFDCNVRLSRAKGSVPEVGSDDDILAVVPCSPALFGPTSMTSLVEKGGLTFYGEVLLPDPLDEYGCAAPLATGNAFTVAASETNSGDDEAQCSLPNVQIVQGGDVEHHENIIQLIHRGECRFQTKASNQARVEDRSGMIVINSDSNIFVMSGACVPGDESCEETESDDFVVPSVLVGKSDGEKIMDLASEVSSSGGTLQATVSLLPPRKAKQSGAVNEYATGGSDTTRTIDRSVVTASSDAIQIFAPNGWGVHAIKKQLEGTSGNQHEQQAEQSAGNHKKKQRKSEWQLFILQHEH